MKRLIVFYVGAWFLCTMFFPCADVPAVSSSACLRPPRTASGTGSEAQRIEMRWRVDMDPVLFARLDSTLQNFLTEVLIPACFTTSSEISPEESRRRTLYLLATMQVYVQSFMVAGNDDAYQDFQSVLAVRQRKGPWQAELIRWVNVYLLLPNGVTLTIAPFAQEELTVESALHGHIVRLCPVHAYELYRFSVSGVVVPVVYTTQRIGTLKGWEAFGAVAVTIDDSIESMHATCLEELSHACDTVYGLGFSQDFRTLYAQAHLLPRSRLRAYLPIASKNLPLAARIIITETKAFLRDLIGPHPQEAYEGLTKLMSIELTEDQMLQAVASVDFDVHILACIFVASWMRAHMQGPVSLEAIQALVPRLWAEEWDVAVEPLDLTLHRVYPQNDAQARAQLKTLAAQAQAGEEIPIVGTSQMIKFSASTISAPRAQTRAPGTFRIFNDGNA